MPTRNAVLTVILACSPLSAQTLDWTRDPAAQLKVMQGAGPAAAPAVHASAPIARAAATSYSGVLKLANETRKLCFTVSPEPIDQYEGDPDVSQGVFVYQAITSFKEEGSAYKGQCATTLEHNGDYIRACSGLYLTTAGSLSKGDVFTDLARFDPSTGALKLRPVGTYELKKVDACR